MLDRSRIVSSCALAEKEAKLSWFRPLAHKAGRIMFSPVTDPALKTTERGCRTVPLPQGG